MKLKPSVGCHSLLAAVIATLATVAQLFAADPAVTISWSNPADIVYGTALSSSQLNATFSTSTGGAVEGTASYEPQLGTYLPAGSAQTLKVTWVPKDDKQGVIAGTKTVVINVSKAPLVASVKNAEAAYGSALTKANSMVGDPTANVTYSGFVRGETAATTITGAPVLKVPAGLTNKAEAGTAYAMAFQEAPTFSNYSVTTQNGTLSVAQKALTFTLSDASIQFGATPVASGSVDIDDATDNGPFGALVGGENGGRGIGWVNDDLDSDNVSITHVHSVKNSSNAGPYDISVVLTEKKAGLLTNYAITVNNGTYTVEKRALTLTFDAGSKEITYGGAIPAFVPAIAMENAGTWTLTAKTGSADARKLDDLAKILTAPVTVEYPAADADVKVNKDTGAVESYTIKTVGGTVFDGNFTLAHATAALKINKAPLTIQASDRTKITGSELPTLGVEFPDGKQFKHGDTAADVFNPYPPNLDWDTGLYADIKTDNGVALANGDYPNAIIFKDIAKDTKSNNYTITALKGDLTVTLQPIQFAWSPASSIMTYGDMFSAANHLNAVSASTITVDGKTYTIPVTTTYDVLDKDGLDVGDVVGGTLDADKKLIGGTLAVAANQFNAGTVNVRVTVTANPDDASVAAIKAKIPAYGSASSTIGFSIGKKALNVKADDQKKTYNTEAFDKTDITYTTADFVGGETAAVIKKDPTVADPTTKTSNVGDYSIIPAGGEDENYAFVYKAGKITVEAAATAATWDPEAAGADAKKHLTYGTALSSTANLNPKVTPDVPGSWSYSVSTSDPTAMTYPGVAVKATFTPDSSNYKKSDVTKTLVVKRRDVDVAPDAQTAVYGDAIPALTGSSNFIESDGITTTFQTGAYAGSPVGTYLISAKFDDSKGRLKNYNVKLSSDADDNSLTITPATLHVTAQNASSAVLKLTEAEADAKVELKLDGLKAESAVLNGIALNATELAEAFGAKEVNYNDASDKDKAKVAKNDLAKLDDRLEGFNLLQNVFLGAGNLPSLDVDKYSNAKEATFTIKVGNLVDKDGKNIALSSNYVLGTVTNASYGVGKIDADFTITLKGGKGSAGDPLVYGTALKADMIQTALAAPAETDKTKGTWSVTIGGESFGGQILPHQGGAKHVVTVTYTPHESQANVYLPTSETIDMFIAQAPLQVTVASTKMTYGDALPYLQTVNYTYGTDAGKNNNFVNGDSSAVFTQQPVVAIIAKLDGKGVPTDYSVNNSPATIKFVQEPSAANYDITTTGGNITINRRPLTVKPADLTIEYGTQAVFSLEYANLAPGETSDNLDSPGFAYLAGSQDTTKLSPGTYTIYSGGAYGANYVSTHGTGTLTVGKQAAIITIADASAVYDGTNKGVSVTTDPAGIDVAVTYDGSSTAPVDAGTYEVVVTVDDPNYGGSVTGTLEITPAPVTITLSKLAAKYNGSAKAVGVKATPAVDVEVSYDGAASAPSAVGSYAVVAKTSDANYSGEASGTLVIGKGTAFIIPSNFTQMADGTAKGLTVDTDPAGLETVVTYTQDVTGANIAFVSFHATDSGSAAVNEAGLNEAADKGYTDVLTAAGHNVTRVLTSGSPDVEALNAYDLVIISRSVSSGGYSSGASADAWNSVTAPTIQLGGYVLRTSRMGYTDGTDMSDTVGTIQLKAEVADHPLFAGVELTDGITGDYAGVVTWNDTVQRGISVNNNAAGADGVVLATVATAEDPTVGGIIAMEYAAGSATTTGGTFAGNRLVLLTGSREAAGVTSETAGLYDLTETGKQMFLNAVGYMANVPRVDTVTPVEAGIYTATITVVDDSYQGSLTTALGIIPGASISFGSLSSAYTGSANPVQVVTDPVGLNVSVTYSKSPNAPSVPGTYPVVATIVDDVYSGTVSGDYVIEPAAAEITLSNLNQPFNSAVAPTVTTSPAGLATIVTYNGELDVPSQPGEYEVEVTVIDTIYAGSATGTLSLGKGAQSITFPAIPNLSINGVSLALVLNASSTSGLPITYNVLEGGATLDGNILTINQPGIVTIVAQQLGNEVFDAAEEKSRFFNVTGTGIPLGAAQSVASLDDDGNLSVSTSGQPFQQMSVYKAGKVNGEFTPILKVMLDENGQSTFKTETNGDQGYFQVK